MEAVRASAAWVASRSSHVTVDLQEIEKVVDQIQGDVPKVEWDYEGIHYFDNGPLTVQYLFVLDALNFCFWPDKDLSYDHLASGLKSALEKDKNALDSDRLQNYTGPQLRQLLNWPRPLPIEEERVRLLHEELKRSFGGQAANLVKSAGNSAATLIELITRHFPGTYSESETGMAHPPTTTVCLHMDLCSACYFGSESQETVMIDELVPHLGI
uniref:Queuosine 5'-phosphate N-glycosylase/hydrolase n=1 Tax=Zea mays TaxID=4577 RepID=A0A804MSG0_MAIZE